MHAVPRLDGLVTETTKDRSAAIGIAVVSLLAWVLAVYGRTTYSMVSIWERSETFAHGFVIIPIFLYLLWRQRSMLATIEPRPFLPALFGIAAAGGVWLIGSRLNANSVTQFAMMAMIPFVVWTLLGTRVLKVLAFPFAFLFFAVPFGEFLIPPFIGWTADFTTMAIRASGVPVFREGNILTIPSGTWSIVEACSGIRYLIASFMVGCLFAYLSYRSPIRRAAFVAASLLVPIVANWVRAYIIVMLGHLSGNRLAVGADHLVYGWVFFGLVMLLLFWIGAKWREDESAQPTTTPIPVATTAAPIWRSRHALIALLCALALTAIWPLLELQQDSRGTSATVPTLAPVIGRDGWTADSNASRKWRPDLSGATAELEQTFVKDAARVSLYVAFYRDLPPGAKAISSTNQLVQSKSSRWIQVADDPILTDIGGQPFRIRSIVAASGRERIAAWQWFWVDGHVTMNEYVAKLYEVLAVLQGHGDPVAWVVISTPTEHGEPQMRATLQAFTAAMREPIEAALRQAAQAR